MVTRTLSTVPHHRPASNTVSQTPAYSTALLCVLETGKELLTQPWEIADQYRERFKTWSKAYERMCLENRIEYVQLSTETPYDVALLRYLEKRPQGQT